MKIILAIIQNDDSMAVTSALTAEKYNVTKLSTTGGFLLTGSTTLMIGSEDDRVGRAEEIIQQYTKERTASVDTQNSLGRGLQGDGLTPEVQVGGATIFVLNVEKMSKY